MNAWATLDEFFIRRNEIAARHDALRQDRINERCDAAEHDPGTPEAWAQGCECERQDGRDGWDVAFGCPMHDPGGE